MNMEIKTKYNIGDIVWTIENDHACCFKIKGIQVSVFHYTDDFPETRSVVYNGDNTEVHREDVCFGTKEELLNSL